MRNNRNLVAAHCWRAKTGIALVLVVITIAGMMVFLSSFLTVVTGYTNVVSNYETLEQARYAADAGLQTVKSFIKSSSFNEATGNTWLNNSAAAAQPCYTMTIDGAIPVSVTVASLGNFWYLVRATATNGRFSTSSSFQVKERQSYLDHLIYDASATPNLSEGLVLCGTGAGADYYGTIHANRNVRARLRANDRPDAIRIYGDLNYNDILYADGAAANVVATGNMNTPATVIPAWIDTNGPSQLAEYMQPMVEASDDINPEFRIVTFAPPWNAALSGSGQFITAITATGTGDTVTIEVWKSGVSQRKAENLPLPANGIIYAGTNVEYYGGPLNGRLTIAGVNQVQIRGSSIYVDNEGDHAYILKKNGLEVDPNSTGTEAWTAANGYAYMPNPDYNPAVPSQLVLMGQDSVYGDTTKLPYNFEFHGVMASLGLSAMFTSTSSGTMERGNMRFVGSQVAFVNAGGGSNALGFGFTQRYGYLKSMGYIYDQNLKTAPPTWFVERKKPWFGAWWRD